MLAEPTIKKIPALTSLRFFAAAAIVYYHCLYYVEVNPNSTWAIGVSFFFVLSGFILTYAYDRSTGLPFGQATWWYIVPTIYVVSYLLWWGVERPCRKAIMDAASTQSLTATRKLLTP